MKSLHKAFRKRKPQYIEASIFALTFAIVGGIFLFVSHAATPAASVEAESGTVASTAAKVSDSTASGASAVKFGPAPSGGGGGGGTGVPAGARGRPTIVNNNLVSDQGTLLRGSTLWLIPFAAGQYDWALSNSSWAYDVQYHLNTVRLAIDYGPTIGINTDPLSLSAAESEIDTDEARAVANNMYVVIDLHWGDGSGGHDQPSAVTFWQAIAAKYANDTNIIFEVLNEPVAWDPDNYSAQDIKDEEQLYSIVRTAAPQSPIVLMSFAVPENTESNPSPTMTDVTNELTGINWSNTVVSFHGYWVNNDVGELQLKAKYPVMTTEYQFPASSGENISVNGDTYQTQNLEKDGISWICWNCDDIQGDVSKLPGLESDATAKGYWWPADKVE